jgi:fumarylacetoacetase
MINDSHDPSLRSWVESANSAGTDFPIQNLPLGVFRSRGSSDPPRIGVAIGDQILDLRSARNLGLLEGLSSAILEAATAPTLNALMALGHGDMSRLRQQLVAILHAHGRRAEPQSLVAMDRAELLLPAAIGDYTDFYASIFHATRVGKLFRPDNPLLPNYKYMPIAYHGRVSSIVPSGTPITRPFGQIKGPGPEPRFCPSERLDYELELGLFAGPGNALAEPLTIVEAEDHIFGLCIVNDWSARDIQAWESQPLGPFLAKNFATTISPWVVTYEALAPFRCPSFVRADDDPRPLPHLSSPANDASGGFDVSVEVSLQSGAMRQSDTMPVRLSGGSSRDMYWTLAQMVAHHTSNGCNLGPGDLLASGTISGAGDGTEGCLLEMTRGGTQPIELPNGEKRAFLADGDEVIMRAFCERAGYARIGFGDCRGIVAPARCRR